MYIVYDFMLFHITFFFYISYTLIPSEFGIQKIYLVMQAGTVYIMSSVMLPVSLVKIKLFIIL